MIEKSKKSRIAYQIILVLLPFIFTNIYSQGTDPLLKLKHITVGQGLESNIINDLYQDEKGFVWIATNNGLQRFDGQDFKTYQKLHGDLGLQSSLINTVFEDNQKRVWIGTLNGGVTIYLPDRNTAQTFTTSNSTIKGNDIYSITQDSLNRIWVGTSKGVELFNDSLQLITSQIYKGRVPKQIFSSGIQSIYIDSRSFIHFGTAIGEFYSCSFNDKDIIAEESFFFDKEKYRDLYAWGKITLKSAVLDIAEDMHGNLWLATWNGLFCLQTQTTENWDNLQNHYFDQIAISSLLFSDEKTLYVGTWSHGLYIINLETNAVEHLTQSSDNPDGLNFNDVLSLMKSKDGNIWIGTAWEGGINILQPQNNKFKHFKISHHSVVKASNVVHAFEEDVYDHLYIGTRKGIYKRNDDLSYTKLIAKNDQLNYAIRSLKYDSIRNILWIGTEGVGLVGYDMKTQTCSYYNVDYTRKNTISNSNIWDIQIDDKNRLWLGTWGGGVDCFNPEENTFVNYPVDTESFGQNTALSLKFDSAGTLWAATYGKGIAYLYKDSTEFSHKLLKSEGDYKGNGLFYDVYIDKNQNVWAASLTSGVVFIDNSTDSISVYSSNNSEFGGCIESILEDDSGAMWASSNHSITVLPSSLQQKKFLPDNGIQENSFSISAGYKRNNGDLLIGHSNGYLEFSPHLLSTNTPDISVEITEISLNDKVLQPYDEYCKDSYLTALPENTESIILPPNLNSFALKFTGFNFTSQYDDEFMFKLDGFDTDWRYTDEFTQKAIYTNIPSGDYVFRVKEKHQSAENERKLYITIEKAFWEESWFYVLVFICIGLLVFGVIYLRTASLKRKNKRLKQMVAARTQKIVDQNRELEEKNEDLFVKSERLKDYYQEVLSQNEEIMAQRDTIKEKHELITASIDYAKKIQEAALPSHNTFSKQFPDGFVLYKPKDTVSGDFYFVFESSTQNILVVADCTGHGVPGALMSMLGISLLNEIMSHYSSFDASLVLHELRSKLISSLNQYEEDSILKDGMDMAICIFEKDMKTVQYAGANMPLYLHRNSGDLEIVKPNRMPVGYHIKQDEHFSNQVISLHEGDRLYLMSDGYVDQFGGPKGKKFKSSQLKKLIADFSNESMLEQKEIFDDTIIQWMTHSINNETEEQIDDIIVLGVQV